MTPFILVIALSARAYAQAAHEAGFKVCVIDAFGDQQTRAVAEQVLTVPTGVDGLEPTSLLQAIAALPLHDCLGLIYGSGFDAQPTLLDVLARRIPCIGNPASVMQSIKDPAHFFACLRREGVLFPETRWAHLTPLGSAETASQATEKASVTWLSKQVGGCGGTHVQFASYAKHTAHQTTVIAPKSKHYAQVWLAGEPYSLLFLATAEGVTVVSVNQQFLSPTQKAPFRYGGGVSHIRLSGTIQAQMRFAAERMAAEYALRGLNSLDVMVYQEDVYVLEINPRLSASLDLQVNKAQLLVQHLIASGFAPSQMQTEYASNNVCPRAMQVVYATKTLTIPTEWAWPAWAQDTPVYNPLYCVTALNQGVRIAVDSPICTVFADGKTASQAKRYVMQRTKLLSKQLQAFEHNGER